MYSWNEVNLKFFFFVTFMLNTLRTTDVFRPSRVPNTNHKCGRCHITITSSPHTTKARGSGATLVTIHVGFAILYQKNSIDRVWVVTLVMLFFFLKLIYITNNQFKQII